MSSLILTSLGVTIILSLLNCAHLEPYSSGIQTVETEDELRTLIQNTPGIVVVNYGATWCESCKDVKHLYDQLAEDYGNRAIFYRTHDEDIALGFQITMLPAFKMFVNGIEITEIDSIDDLKSKLNMITH